MKNIIDKSIDNDRKIHDDLIKENTTLQNYVDCMKYRISTLNGNAY